jgi:hypothetical protein
MALSPSGKNLGRLVGAVTFGQKQRRPEPLDQSRQFLLVSRSTKHAIPRLCALRNLQKTQFSET